MTGRQAGTVLQNIQAVVHMETDQEQQRSFKDKIADAIGTFAGTVTFVLLHLLWFALWAGFNTRALPVLPAFDPYPFPLLCMIVSLEGVLLSTFVLIKQNRMGQRTDRRNQLDLQINLLTEKEVTKVIQMLEQISAKLGLPLSDADTRELAQVTAVGDLADELKRSMPEDP